MSLKESISEKHKFIESQPFSRAMLSGNMKEETYLKYLFQMVEVFSAIEKRLELPSKLKRRDKVVLDIRELLMGSSEKDYVFVEIETFSPKPEKLQSTKKYVEHILSCEEKNLMAHVYINYMALIFGGQVIKKSVPGSGKMYEFEESSKSIEYIRSQQTDEWADEANLALDYRISIHDELQGLPEFEV